MEEEKNMDFVTEDITVSDVLPVYDGLTTSEPNTEEIKTDDIVKPYDKLDKLNLSLDELANDLEAEKQVEEEIKTSINEIEMPTVSNEEVSEDLTSDLDSKEADDFKEELTKEINVIEDDTVDASSEAGSKGQFILIVILTLILIALLVAMIVFTNAL